MVPAQFTSAYAINRSIPSRCDSRTQYISPHLTGNILDSRPPRYSGHSDPSQFSPPLCASYVFAFRTGLRGLPVPASMAGHFATLLPGVLSPECVAGGDASAAPLHGLLSKEGHALYCLECVLPPKIHRWRFTGQTDFRKAELRRHFARAQPATRRVLVCGASIARKRHWHIGACSNEKPRCTLHDYRRRSLPERNPEGVECDLNGFSDNRGCSFSHAKCSLSDSAKYLV